MLIQEHMHHLTSLPTCATMDDATTLRKIHTTAMMNYKALQQLGMAEETLGSITFLSLSKVLPRDLMFRFHRNPVSGPSRHSTNSNATTSSSGIAQSGYALLEFLGNDLATMERARHCDLTASASNANKHSKTENKKGLKGTSAGMLHVGTPSGNACLLCKRSNHKTEDCTATLSMAEKKKLLFGRCFKCTWSGHQSKNCHRKVQCQKCRGRHATSMCDPSARERTRQPDAGATHPRSVSEEEAPSSAPQNDAGNHHVGGSSTCTCKPQRRS